MFHPLGKGDYLANENLLGVILESELDYVDGVLPGASQKATLLHAQEQLGCHVQVARRPVLRPQHHLRPEKPAKKQKRQIGLNKMVVQVSLLLFMIDVHYFTLCMLGFRPLVNSI